MGRQTRNHSVAGVALLVGAATIAFGATQAWATGSGTVWGRLAELTVDDSPGFGLLPAPGGQYGTVQQLLFGCAATLAVSALLLFATRVPGLGVLWRLLALATLVVLGLTAAGPWSVVNDPASVIAEPDSPLGEALRAGVSGLESSGLGSIEPGLGLWLVTLGSAIGGIGALIPATRGRRFEMAPRLAPDRLSPTEARMLPGWYPDQLDGRFVRFFDGAHWTGATRLRG